MNGSRVLRRLARVQRLEEERAQAAMEIVRSELRRLEHLRRLALERERAGRMLIAHGVLNGEQTDWIAGQEEVRTARRLGAIWKLRIAEAEKEFAERQELFLARRVARQQTETLMEAAKERASRDFERRAQQAADEWFLDRRRAEQTKATIAGQDSAAGREV